MFIPVYIIYTARMHEACITEKLLEKRDYSNPTYSRKFPSGLNKYTQDILYGVSPFSSMQTI